MVSQMVTYIHRISASPKLLLHQITKLPNYCHTKLHSPTIICFFLWCECIHCTPITSRQCSVSSVSVFLQSIGRPGSDQKTYNIQVLAYIQGNTFTLSIHIRILLKIWITNLVLRILWALSAAREHKKSWYPFRFFENVKSPQKSCCFDTSPVYLWT